MACLLAGQVIVAVDATSATLGPMLRDARMPASEDNTGRDTTDNVRVFDEFVQVSPTPGAAPSYRTELRIAHDGRMLRLFVRAFDADPSAIVAQQMRRDATALLSDDHVAVVIDVEGQGRNGFLFVINVHGTQYDSLIYDGGREHHDWDAYWHSEARSEPDGWSATLVIPLSALGVRSGASTPPWRLNAERWMARGNERVRLAGSQPDKDVYSLSDALSISAIEGDSDGWGLRLKPSVRLSLASTDETAERLEPGVEIFHQTAADLRTAAAFNIDFGEAEADDRQINLTRFELFRAEKREFFLQDAGRFTFGGLAADSPMPYYSRRVGLDGAGGAHDLDAALKFSGRAGGFDFGLIGARVSGDAQMPGEPVQPDADMGVLRVARLLTPTNRLGVVVTAGNPDGTSGSMLWGMDYQHHNAAWLGTKTLSVNAWMQQSENAGLSMAQAYGVNVDYPNLGLTGNASIQRIERDFLPALGFLEEDAVTQSQGELGWWHRIARGGDVIPQLDWNVRRTLDGRERSTLLNPEILFENAAGDYLFPEWFFETDELASGYAPVPGLNVEPGRYRWDYFWLGAGTSRARPVSLEFEGRVGGYYNGRRNDQDLTLYWQPNPQWGLSAGAGRTAITLPSGRFTVKTATARLDFTPSTALGTSVLLEWDNISEALGISARVRWRWRTARELFLAFDRLSYTDARRETDPEQMRALVKFVWNFDY